MDSRWVQVAPRIFVGNSASAVDLDLIVDNDIDAMMCLTSRAPKEVEGVDYFHYHIPDWELSEAELARVAARLDTIVEDLRALQANARAVLVCCDEGRFQAPLVVGWYLRRNGNTAEETIRLMEQLYFTDAERAADAAERVALQNIDYTTYTSGVARAVDAASIQARDVRNAKRCLAIRAYKKLLRG